MSLDCIQVNSISNSIQVKVKKYYWQNVPKVSKLKVLIMQTQMVPVSDIFYIWHYYIVNPDAASLLLAIWVPLA